MRYHFYTADVFTERIFGGNPLAVFPAAQGLAAEQMQLVTREINLSETVFVLPAESAEHARKLRIFTPGTELPFAGHPTVGTAFVLAAIGELALQGDVTRIVFEEGVGPVPVSILARAGQPVAAQLAAARAPEFGPPPPSVETLAAVLSLNPADIMQDEYGPQAISCGVPFLFVPVRSRNAIRRARLNREQWDLALATYWAPHLYLLTFETELEGAQIHARMFAPAMGIVEDPATGAAATALAGYLGVRDKAQSGTLRWTVEQGIEIGRPSLLHVEADKSSGQILAARVGGAAILVSEGDIEIPQEYL